MERDQTPEPIYEQLVLFDVREIGRVALGEQTALNRWDDMGRYIDLDSEESMGNYFEGDDRIITVFQHGHVDRYGPLGDERSIARDGEW